MADSGSNEAKQTYGGLKEGLHITGYTFERACAHLEWLLEDDRWKSCGFDDIGSFLESVRLDQFRTAAEQRKRLAKRIKELTDASNKDVAKVLGVSDETVRRDTGATNVEPQPKKNSKDDGGEAGSTTNVVPVLSGAEAAQLVAKSERKEVEAKERRSERLEKIAEISKGNLPLGAATKYPIVYADPPWRYENPPIGASNRSIENHYPTMTLEEICALPVSDLATDDAMLYLWATAPKLAECLKVIEAWGFEYRTNMVWDKEVIGMGYHARNQHEILLIAKRGSIPPPEAGTQPSSVYRERRGDHSTKPDFYYEMIEAAYPQLPKIELFSRSPREGPREGWAVWGNQAVAA